MKKISLLVGFVMLWALAGLSAAPGAAQRVLCITDTPETQDTTYLNGNGAYMYTLDYFLSPQHILANDFAVNQVGWLETGSALANLAPYRAVMLWNCPARITDKRNNDPHYQDLDLLTGAAGERLVKFVEDGGTLVVAGGVTCYGNAIPWLGSADARKGRFRFLFGYAKTPLAAILPVEIPDGETLQLRIDAKKKPLAVQAVKADPMVAGLDLNAWGFDAYHKVLAKPGAEVLVAATNGDPIVVRWKVKKGSVICVTASSRGNVLFLSKRNPIWPPEAVLWDRCLRWGLGEKPDLAREKEAEAKYRRQTVLPARQGLAEIQQEFPYGTHAIDTCVPMGLGDLAFKYFNDLNMNTLVMQGSPTKADKLDAFLKDYTRGLRNNNLVAYLHPEPASSARQDGVDPKEYAQITLPSGKFALHYGYPYPCPFSTTTVSHAVREVERFMPVLAKYPEIRGAFYDDEWAWVMGYRNAYEGGRGVGSYSPWANERFKKLTGMDAPPPVYRAPGYVAPENEPWLKWAQLTRLGAYRDYNQKISDAMKAVRPDFQCCNYPGAFEGNLDLMLEEVYLDCWKESELEAFVRMDVRYNGNEDRQRSKVPLWALIGVFRMPEDKSMYPETLRLTVGATLAAGAKGVVLWNSVNLWAPYLQHPGRGSLDAEARALGEYIRKFGPMFLNLKRAGCPLWTLSGWFWVNSFDQYYHLENPQGDPEYKEGTWWPIQLGEIVAPAALRAGLLPEFVTEKQLLSPELFKMKAVFLPGMLYSRQAVMDQLDKYIAQGGKVFVDQSTKVPIKGATVLPIDLSRWHREVVAKGQRPIIEPTETNYRKHRAMREEYVREAIPVLQKAMAGVLDLPVTVDSTEAVCALMENGATRYVVVLNSNTDTGNTFRVTWRGSSPVHIYDLEQSKPVAGQAKAGETSWSVALPAGGWKVFAVSAVELTGLRVSQPRVQHGRLILQVQPLAGEDKVFDGALPLEIRLQAKGAEQVLYRSTDRGVLNLDLPLADGMKGVEAITVTELFSGLKASQPVSR